MRSIAGANGSWWAPWPSKPVSGVFGVRGGFDSHAFPPGSGRQQAGCTCLRAAPSSSSSRRRIRRAATLLVVSGLLAFAANVATAQADATAADADTLAAEAGGFSAPTWVMLRSLAIPGWGQATNGAWWKAVLVAGVEGAFLERLRFEDRMVDEFDARAGSAAQGSLERARFEAAAERHREMRRDFTWWTCVAIALSMGDAYVDAHLKGFDVRLQAEPDADEDEPAAGPTEAVGLRLMLRAQW